jgi:hypothetical protein
MKRNAYNDPLRNPATAFGKLDEDKYRAERDLVDRYQAFVAELLRLSLLGIAVLGFLYKITFEAGAPIGVAHVLERVMNLSENRVEMRIQQSAWFPRVFRFPHS